MPSFYFCILFMLLPYLCSAVSKINTEDPISSHPAWKNLSNSDCGDSAADRIIGGTNANLGQFPWIVRIGYLEDGGNGELLWQCGGALVNEHYVVTAAHCVMSKEEEITPTMIRLGEHNIRNNPDCELSVCAPPVQDIKVKKWRTHPSFNKPAYHNDIAVIELEKPAVLNGYVAPICLPKTMEQRSEFRVGEIMVTAGWGKTNLTTDENADTLQVVTLPIVKPELCNELGKYFKISISEVCAGTERNKDACTGDSGGPLMKVFDTLEGPKNFLVGVVSFGPLMCGNEKPGVYTSISYFLKWILDNIM
ncbi:phenoloxidase-activating factor 3 [Bombyx mori]|uniref:limulus clotting factor C n=1 Tax=Bombyx mori TaxID=7091 RepID=A0A8R2C593_BOMMO|nr:phenoloxidase-activating factor 3 [Bombyx mori]